MFRLTIKVKRTPSVRGMPISPPQLNFSTNSIPQDKMTTVGVVARPLPAPPGEYSYLHVYYNINSHNYCCRINETGKIALDISVVFLS